MVKFDHFEIRIMYHFPCAKKLDGISRTYPVLDNIGCAAFALLAIGHIRKGNVVFVVVRQDCYLRILYCYLCHSFLVIIANIDRFVHKYNQKNRGFDNS